MNTKNLGRWLGRRGSAFSRAAGRFGNSLGSALLLIMFILMVLVSADAIYQAYRDLYCTNAKIGQTLAEVRSHISQITAGPGGPAGTPAAPAGTGSDEGGAPAAAGDPTAPCEAPCGTGSPLTPETEAFVTCLEAHSREGVDSNTISFLFQVFSFCLVSAGVYLLNRSHQNLKVAEGKVSLIGPFIANAPVTSTISGYLQAAYQISWLLRTAEGKLARASYIAHLRELLGTLKQHLEDALHDERGIERSHQTLFVDLITHIVTNLRHCEDREAIENLIVTCETCERLLEKPGFTENYRGQLEGLLDRPLG